MKKTLTVVIALVLVVVMSVAGTVAYLTSTKTVTNTFTVGKVEITLDETKVDVYGNALTGEEAGRDTKNTYKLIPGQPYTKDPIVHFQPKSEASWLFVKVENDISAIEADTTIAAQILANGWTKLDGETGVYYKQVPANNTSAAVDYPVFRSFTLKGDADVAAYDGKTVVVTAYAIQAAGFTTAEAAWAEVSK